MNAAEEFDWREFMRGKEACQQGQECPEGASEEFQRGFSARYALEQCQTAQSEVRYGN